MLLLFFKFLHIKACIHALTKHDAGGGGTSGVVDKDEISLDVDQTTVKFVDLARQMESFFIQKRFLLSAMKPELVLKEENFDLRYEMSRKDDLIRRYGLQPKSFLKQMH